jgi:hypothetical protein
VKTISRILIGATMLVLAVLGYVFGSDGAVNLLAFFQSSMAAILAVLLLVLNGEYNESGAQFVKLEKCDRHLSVARTGFSAFQLLAVLVAVFFGGWFVAAIGVVVLIAQELVCEYSDTIQKAKKTSCTK